MDTRRYTTIPLLNDLLIKLNLNSKYLFNNSILKIKVTVFQFFIMKTSPVSFPYSSWNRFPYECPSSLP